MRLFGEPLYWRESHRQPRFLAFDGRVVVMILLCVMHIRLWTIGLLALSLLVLFYFGRKGISADSILRFLRSQFVGSRRTARGHEGERSFVDFGFESMDDLKAMDARIVGQRQSMIAIRKKLAKAADKHAVKG